MRLVVQRVNKAKVEAQKRVVGEIDKGLFVLLGIGEGDTRKNAEEIVKKLLKLRVMADSNDKMNLDIKEAGGSILVVSQFTLYADMSRGNRPSFIKAAKPDVARDLYKYFISLLVEAGVYTQTGEFGEYMDIDLELDGPVTILMTNDPPAGRQTDD